MEMDEILMESDEILMEIDEILMLRIRGGYNILPVHILKMKRVRDYPY